jgi:hypothetical protein
MPNAKSGNAIRDTSAISRAIQLGCRRRRLAQARIKDINGQLRLECLESSKLDYAKRGGNASKSQQDEALVPTTSAPNDSSPMASLPFKALQRPSSPSPRMPLLRPSHTKIISLYETFRSLYEWQCPHSHSLRIPSQARLSREASTRRSGYDTLAIHRSYAIYLRINYPHGAGTEVQVENTSCGYEV